jgi:esterase
MQAIELNNSHVSLNTLILNPQGKETIVMVHGIFGNFSQFYLTIAPELSKHYRIVLYDLRSHGKSTTHSTGYDLWTLTNDLRELLNVLNIDKCHLLGFSFGTLVVLKFAMLFNEMVDKIVVLDVPSKHMFYSILRGSYQFKDFLEFVALMPTLLQKTFMRKKRQLEKNYKTYDYIVNHTSFIEDIKKYHEFSAEDYQCINVPIKLIFGKQSFNILELNRIRDWIQHKEISFLDGGHYFFCENPRETAEMVRDFLIKPNPVN